MGWDLKLSFLPRKISFLLIKYFGVQFNITYFLISFLCIYRCCCSHFHKKGALKAIKFCYTGLGFIIFFWFSYILYFIN